VVWPPVQPPSDAGRLSGCGDGVRRRRRSGVRQRLQRDGECSGEVGVSATIDGWDQGRGKEGLRRLPGVRGQRQRQPAPEELGGGEVEAGWGARGCFVFRFKHKPFFDSSGRYCFHFKVGFPLYLFDGTLFSSSVFSPSRRGPRPPSLLVRDSAPLTSQKFRLLCDLDFIDHLP
jgi:hypothetical protein